MTTQSSKPTAQGGFVHGIPQTTESLTTVTATSGCCGESVAQVSASVPGVQSVQGCCGEPAAATGVKKLAGGCCGELVMVSSSAQTGCCN